MAEKKKNYKLKGHEKFTLRDGWLNKGILALDNNYSKMFNEDDATDRLGVGSNMVKSIRYWLKAFSLSDESNGKGTRLSELGQLIKDNDIYFEDIFTLWVLHSNLVKNKFEATTWYMFFNYCDVEEFKKENIEELLKEEFFKYVGESVSESSLKDDITVLLGMYCREKDNNYDPEDKNVSPLATLGIIGKNKDIYIRKQPNLSKFSVWIILYEIASLFDNNQYSVSLSIDTLYAGENGIGNIYNLSRVALNEYLDKLENMSYIRVNRTAGLDVVYKQFEGSAIDILRKYYNEHKVG